jgi:type II secretory pathway component PulJ
VSRRAGFTAVEALVSFLLVSLLLQAGWTLTAGIARASAAIAERAEGLAASRAVGWILQEELEGARAGSDVSTPAGDSIGVRAFRGTARVCAGSTARSLLVRWSGLRAPDPAKDSLLVLLSSGRWASRALAARTAGSGECAGSGGSLERWTLGDSVAPAALVRLFERGSYHLSDEALRYRIGAGGRQPLTPARFDPARSGIVRSGLDRVVLVVSTRGGRGGGGGPEWRRSFRLAEAW